MEGVEQVPLILLRNANPVVANNANDVRSVPLDDKMNSGSRLGVFHRVGQEVGENVPEQSFICLRFGGNPGERKLNQALPGGRRMDLIHEPPEKTIQVDGGGLKSSLPASRRLRIKTSSIMPAMRRVFRLMESSCSVRSPVCIF